MPWDRRSPGSARADKSVSVHVPGGTSPISTTALRNGRFDTVLGAIAFDRNGDLVEQPWTLYIWNNGAYGELGGGS